MFFVFSIRRLPTFVPFYRIKMVYFTYYFCDLFYTYITDILFQRNVYILLWFVCFITNIK